MSVLAEKTKEVYTNANKRLAAALKVEALTPELLAESKRIIDFVESMTKKDGKPLGTEAKKGHLNALMSLLPRSSELWNTYSEKVRSYYKVINDITLKQELTEREATKWLSWEDILAVRDKLRPETPEDFFAYQDWVILCLYTMVPPLRVDYSPMRVVEELPQEKGNFLVLSPTKNCFVLQEYKTAGTYGRQEFDIPGELLDVLYEWVVFNPTGWLLIKSDGEPYSDYNLSQRVGRIMEKATRPADGSAGKICGITMFRHAYKTFMHKGEPTLVAAGEEARRMLHSPQMAQQYRRPEKE
jgi:hypothetical protein